MIINIKKCFNEKEVLDSIENVTPAELLIPENNKHIFNFILNEKFRTTITYIKDTYFNFNFAKNFFSSSFPSKKEFASLKFNENEIISIGSLIGYISYTQNGKIPIMSLPKRNENEVPISIREPQNVETEVHGPPSRHSLTLISLP